MQGTVLSVNPGASWVKGFRFLHSDVLYDTNTSSRLQSRWWRERLHGSVQGARGVIQ